MIRLGASATCQYLPSISHEGLWVADRHKRRNVLCDFHPRHSHAGESTREKIFPHLTGDRQYFSVLLQGLRDSLARSFQGKVANTNIDDVFICDNNRDRIFAPVVRDSPDGVFCCDVDGGFIIRQPDVDNFLGAMDLDTFQFTRVQTHTLDDLLNDSIVWTNRHGTHVQRQSVCTFVTHCGYCSRGIVWHVRRSRV